MIYLKLFLTFLEIGTVSFGGGYGMIALVREAVLGNGWLTEEEFLNLIAVSESTPGPIAVNTATFVGSTQGGFFGALAATLGVVLPSFVIILVIAALIRNFLQYAGVQAFLSGVRPCVVAMILATAVTMGLKSLVQFQCWGDSFCAGLEKSGDFRPALGGASLLEKNAEKSAVAHGDDRAFGADGDFVFRAGVRGFFTVSADQWLPAGSGRK